MACLYWDKKPYMTRARRAERIFKMLTYEKALEIGSVSHGTLRLEDLTASFMFLLEEIDKPRAAKITNEYIALEWPYSMAGLAFGEDFSENEVQQENAVYLLESLLDALAENAPDFMYFGAHYGDGSDFGFWLDYDALENANADEIPTELRAIWQEYNS